MCTRISQQPKNSQHYRERLKQNKNMEIKWRFGMFITWRYSCKHTQNATVPVSLLKSLWSPETCYSLSWTLAQSQKVLAPLNWNIFKKIKIEKYCQHCVGLPKGSRVVWQVKAFWLKCQSVNKCCLCDDKPRNIAVLQNLSSAIKQEVDVKIVFVKTGTNTWERCGSDQRIFPALPVGHRSQQYLLLLLFDMVWQFIN